MFTTLHCRIDKASPESTSHVVRPKVLKKFNVTYFCSYIYYSEKTPSPERLALKARGHHWQGSIGKNQSSQGGVWGSTFPETSLDEKKYEVFIPCL
jgi:hypothetical protein